MQSRFICSVTAPRKYITLEKELQVTPSECSLSNNVFRDRAASHGELNAKELTSN